MNKCLTKSLTKCLHCGLILVALGLSCSSMAADNSLTADEKSGGWELLFNGQDISQWRTFKQPDLSDKWQIKDGALTLAEPDAGDILTKKTYKNFELQLDWKISEGGNSGVLLLADEKGKYIYSHAPEIQILDNERHSDGKLPSHRSGSLYDLIASPPSSHKIAGEWNHVRILLDHKSLKVWQNDIMTTDIVLGSDEWKTLLAGSKFKDWPDFATNESGYVGLQDHGNEVAFKNIKIKPLQD